VDGRVVLQQPASKTCAKSPENVPAIFVELAGKSRRAVSALRFFNIDDIFKRLLEREDLIPPAGTT
jgi:hypothetical protein